MKPARLGDPLVYTRSCRYLAYLYISERSVICIAMRICLWPISWLAVPLLMRSPSAMRLSRVSVVTMPMGRTRSEAYLLRCLLDVTCGLFVGHHHHTRHKHQHQHHTHHTHHHHTHSTFFFCSASTASNRDLRPIPSSTMIAGCATCPMTPYGPHRPACALGWHAFGEGMLAWLSRSSSRSCCYLAY